MPGRRGEGRRGEGEGKHEVGCGGGGGGSGGGLARKRKQDVPGRNSEGEVASCPKDILDISYLLT